MRMDEHVAGDALTLTGFRALRLADSRVGDPIAHRILSRPYRAVPERVREWLQQGRLIRDPSAGLYLHEYTSHGMTVRGVVGALGLAGAESHVHPHEKVHPQQVEQLVERMEAMALNPGPILTIHRGPASVREVLDILSADPPDFVYTDRADQLHRIWRLPVGAAHDQVADALRDAHVVIADGHHRYEAARRLHARHLDTGWDRTLVMVVDQDDTPLQLSAIHRSIPRLDLATVARCASEVGAVWTPEPTSHRALAHLDRALVLHDGNTWGTLRPQRTVPLLVSWLHEVLLPAWGVDAASVAHHHSATEAMARAGAATAVLLPAPSFGQVAASARSQQLLPQKASSFQPKPHLGVLMRQVRAESGGHSPR